MSTATSSVRSMLLTLERRVFRAGQQRALANAHAAVLEARERAALRAAAHESLIRLGATAE
jgi:hypothetical protein